ncbi:hypothetical protein E4U54_000281 [Claviceps lovelessii]|nr:hypothetical protein E4U54_000281 [Claviceps lovelessii]
MRASSVLALLLPLTGVLGNKHATCDCMSWSDDGQGWRYDWMLTKWVCFKDIEGCVTEDGKHIDGDHFETSCKSWGEKCGFYPMRFEGFSYKMTDPLMKVGAAVGHCPDRE